MPVTNAKERVARGELKVEDIPYMQRGGNWDNSDVKGAKKVKWLKSDKYYADGGFKKEQSVSIFGYGKGLDWTGARGKLLRSILKIDQETKPSIFLSIFIDKKGPTVQSVPKPKNYKPPNIKDIKKNAAAEPPKKKGFFGLF